MSNTARDVRPHISPADLAAVGRDELQELKEAVCDAVIERTRRCVSGEDPFSQVIYNARPSRVLASGFLLPRIGSSGDEEANDITIPTHGLDCRLAVDAVGAVRLQPAFCVYARALPSEEEMFDLASERGVRLRPKARLNQAAAIHMRDRVRQLTQAEVPPGTPRQRREALRQEIQHRVYREMGIQAPAGPIPLSDDIGTDDLGDQDGADLDLNAEDIDLRIPDHLSIRHETPEKYVRLRVETPPLELPLPYDDATWLAAAEAYETTLRAAIADTYMRWVATDEGRDWAWRPGVVPSSAFWTRENWRQHLAAVRRTPPDPTRLDPGMQAKLLVQPLLDVLDPLTLTVRFALENFREVRRELESGLFCVRLTTEVSEQALRLMHFERVRRSYHLAGFMQLAAIGVNGGVEHRHAEGGPHVLTTTWAPRFVLPRMRQAAVADVPVAYHELAEDTLDVAVLHALPRAMEAWVKRVRAETELFAPDETRTAADQAREEERFNRDLDAWGHEAARVTRGVKVLERGQVAYRRDPGSLQAAPYRAWLLLSRAFRDANPRERASSDARPPGWRLFQIAFVLTHLPTLASRVPSYEDFFDQAFDEDAASLLYMSTGGGKSEAFYGALIYGLFLDRLRGKRRGVTAMIHYPLRLLTLQQAQRLMRLLARAETIRNAENLGGAAFEIGFWVGSGNAPNSLNVGDFGRETEDAAAIPPWNHPAAHDEAALKAQLPGYEAKSDAWNKLPECPFCGSTTVLRMFSERYPQLGIVCTASGSDVSCCEWTSRHGTTPEPLPFLLVDKDIYRHAPSVLLGTVDKLALIGNQPLTINRIAGMFGLARWIDGADDVGALFSPTWASDLNAPARGVRQIAPAYRGGAEIFFDPLPCLIIQDELHLLEESLGTFGGIFETTLLSWFGEIAALMGDRVPRAPGNPAAARMPHIVGATATAADAERQMANLYQRRVVQFPHPGPKLYRSFYTELAEFEHGGEAATSRTRRARTPREQEVAAPWARVYVSLLTNGRPHTATSIAILSAHAAGLTRWMRDLSSGDGARQDRAASEIADMLSDNPLQPRHRAAVDRCRGAGRYDLLATLLDLHRIDLTYVTNKKGGDQLLSALAREAPREHRAMGPNYAIEKFQTELISGGVDIKSIQAVIRKAERLFQFGNENIEEVLRCIVATSAISHGVDVEMFNAMHFAGVPSDIAEYIQASSRVGRTHVGFSMLIPTPQNRRDRFIVEVHEPFHRFLEGMISPPAIERWADKAIKRTIPSLVQTFFAGVLYQRYFCAAAASDKARVRFPGTAPALQDEVSKQQSPGRPWDPDDGPRVIEACVRFVQRAVGLGGLVGAAPTPEYYRNLVRNEVGLIISELQSGAYGGQLAQFWDSHFHNLPTPMKSLRDVDETGEIFAARSTRRVPNISLDRVAAAMALVRNRRIGGRRSAAIGSELDDDAGAGDAG